MGLLLRSISKSNELHNLDVNTLKIAIIDDDEVSNFIYRKVIETTKVAGSIKEFQRARQALDFFIKNINDTSALPDLVFLDINMPIMNGWQFLEEYSKRVLPGLPKRIVLCMLSSSVYKKDVDEAKKNRQVDEYLSKPLTQDKIEFLVEKYFGHP